MYLCLVAGAFAFFIAAVAFLSIEDAVRFRGR